MADKLLRHTVVKDVLLGKMVVSDLNQRKRNEARVDHLFKDFDLDQIGYPIMSEREGRFYVIDGQHRIEALKRWLGQGWEAQKIACAVYQNLTESQEAEMFLRHNDVLVVSVLDKFRCAVNAKRPLESGIKQVVEAHGMHIGYDASPGRIMAVATLRNVTMRSDLTTLGRVLRIIRDSFGDAGLEAPVIGGLGHLCKRYNGVLDEARVTERLGNMRGGVKGLLNRAEEIRLRTGNTRELCVAAAAVDVIKTGKGNQKLPSWWTE